MSVLGSTDRLKLESLGKKHVVGLKAHFGQKKVVEMYGNGKLWSEQQVSNYIKKHTDRQGKKDPFHAFAVLLKGSGDFVGQVVISHGYVKSEAHIAYSFNPKFWNQGYGKEAVTLLVLHIGKLLKGKTAEGGPCDTISGVVSDDNVGAIKIFERTGFEKVDPPTGYQGEKYYYSRKVPA